MANQHDETVAIKRLQANRIILEIWKTESGKHEYPSGAESEQIVPSEEEYVKTFRHPVEIPVGGHAEIGRYPTAPGGAAISIEGDPNVSRRHFQIGFHEDRRIWIKDTSTNGVFFASGKMRLPFNREQILPEEFAGGWFHFGEKHRARFLFK